MVNYFKKFATRIAKTIAFCLDIHLKYFLVEKFRVFWIDEQRTVSTKQGFKINVSPREHLGSPVYFFREIDTEMSNFIAFSLLPGMRAIDIGAEKGWYSLLMGHCVGDQGSVHSFEPVPQNYERLKKNIDLNGFSWIQANQIALADKDYESQITVHPPPTSAGEPDFNTGLSYLTDQKSHNTIKIQCQKLDTYASLRELNKVHLVKIDVEGQELNVLKGGIAFFEKHKPTIVIEYNPATCARAGYSIDILDNYLKEMGYQTFVISSILARFSLKNMSTDIFYNIACIHQSTIDSTAPAESNS